MASSKHYAYYIRGNQIAILEHDANSGAGLNYSAGTHHTGGGYDGVTNPLGDIGPSGSSLWKSPTEAIADGIEIEYAYSPRYFIESTNVNTTTLSGWDQDNDGNLRFRASGSTDWTSSPNLSAVTHVVLKNAGRWNGLHKVSSVTNNRLVTTTKVSGSTNETLFEETVTMYYDVNALSDEADHIDLPEYLTKALVYYVKAKLAEDQMDLEAKEYLMREFRRILEKHESSKVWGARQLGVGPHGIR